MRGPSLTSATAPLRRELCALGERYHRAGWLFGTSGNLSARVTTDAGDRVVVTASGRDKGRLDPEDFVELDLDGALLAAGDGGRPSAEASIHLALYRTRPRARVVLHVHTVASTLTTPDGAFSGDGDAAPVPRRRFAGLEMIKGWDLWDPEAVADLAIFPNWPDVVRIAQDVERFYRAHQDAPVPALLVAGHGITAWGDDAFSANRHLEVAEFLCRVAVARG